MLGHEIVHAAARHGAQQMEKGQLLQIGAAVASIGAAVYGGSELGQVVGQGATVGAQLLQAKYGRDDELESDRYGMKYMKLAGYDLQAAVSLQELFVRKYSAGTEQDWMTGLFASHPPSQERVDANRRTMKEMGGPGGDLGTERYHAAMAGLKRAAPAYEKHQQALAAANKGDYATARRLASEAVKLEPRESRFHGLLGDLALAEKNPRAALPYFQRAGELDPGYFKPMVQAGVAQYQLGNRAAAEPLLERSMKLLSCCRPRPARITSDASTRTAATPRVRWSCTRWRQARSPRSARRPSDGWYGSTSRRTRRLTCRSSRSSTTRAASGSRSAIARRRR